MIRKNQIQTKFQCSCFFPQCLVPNRLSIHSKIWSFWDNFGRRSLHCIGWQPSIDRQRKICAWPREIFQPKEEELAPSCMSRWPNGIRRLALACEVEPASASRHRWVAVGGASLRSTEWSATPKSRRKSLCKDRLPFPAKSVVQAQRLTCWFSSDNEPSETKRN